MFKVLVYFYYTYYALIPITSFVFSFVQVHCRDQFACMSTCFHQKVCFITDMTSVTVTF